MNVSVGIPNCGSNFVGLEMLDLTEVLGGNNETNLWTKVSGLTQRVAPNCGELTIPKSAAPRRRVKRNGDGRTHASSERILLKYQSEPEFRKIANIFGNTGGALSPFSCPVRHEILPRLNPNCPDGVDWVCGLDGWGIRTKQTLGRQRSET
jgi:hypothetical protein